MGRKDHGRQRRGMPVFLLRRFFQWALVAGAALAVLHTARFFPSNNYGDSRVTYVYDGDTVKLANGEKVRLIGIDCPEMRDNDKLFADARRTGEDAQKLKALGQRSYEFARQLLDNRRVRLEFDIQRRDKYGRLLAYVYTREEVTGKTISFEPIPEVIYLQEEAGRQYVETFVNALIINEGYAYPMTIAPNTQHADLFQKLYQQARDRGRGLWRKS